MRVFIMAMRNDIRDMGVQVLDLSPNTSLKNNNLDGVGQTQYAGHGFDTAGTTKFNGDGYISGSKMTSPLSALVADDTTGGGNDVQATHAAALGLIAYLRERVQPGGTANPNAGPLAVADAASLAMTLLRALGAGDDLELADINTILSDVAVGGTVATDLDGAAANSKSFGSVTDILRLMCGEVYRVPRFIIITNLAGQFRSLAERAVLVAAQTVAANGGTTFAANGGFLTTLESGYVGIPTTAWTEALTGSLYGGDLSVLRGRTAAGAVQNMTLLNPNFAYTAADTTVYRPRAYYAADAAVPQVVPETGIAPGIAVYEESGQRIG